MEVDNSTHEVVHGQQFGVRKEWEGKRGRATPDSDGRDEKMHLVD